MNSLFVVTVLLSTFAVNYVQSGKIDKQKGLEIIEVIREALDTKLAPEVENALKGMKVEDHDLSTIKGQRAMEDEINNAIHEQVKKNHPNEPEEKYHDVTNWSISSQTLEKIKANKDFAEFKNILKNELEQDEKEVQNGNMKAFLNEGADKQ